MSFTLHQFLTQLIQVLSSERERECPMWTTSVPLYAMFQLENYSFFFCRTSQLAFPCFTNLIKTTLQQTTFKPNQLCGFRGFFQYYYFSSEQAFTSFIIPCSQYLLPPLFTELDPSALTPAKLPPFHSPGRTLLEASFRGRSFISLFEQARAFFFFAHTP